MKVGKHGIGVWSGCGTSVLGVGQSLMWYGLEQPEGSFESGFVLSGLHVIWSVLDYFVST